MVYFFALGGVGSYTEEVQFSTAETGIGETEEVSGHSSVGSPQMLPRQAVAGTPTPKNRTSSSVISWEERCSQGEREIVSYRQEDNIGQHTAP